MANSFLYKETQFAVGDTVTINYRLKEGDKERTQLFKGILIKVKGDSMANRTITIRRIGHMGIGVEKILPLMSPYIVSIKLDKHSNQQKAKLYYIRNLSDQELRNTLYQVKVKPHSVKKN